MILRRVVRPALRPFVRLLWAMEPDPSQRARPRERMLPAGTTHLAIRLADAPVVLLDGPHDRAGRPLASSIVGGPRATSYLRDPGHAVASVGVDLAPAGAALLVDGAASELADRHTPLEDLWGLAARELRDRLAEEPSLVGRLDILEDALAARLPRVRGVHPAIAYALARFEEGARVGEVAHQTGYSERHLGTLFRRAVGLAPKVFCRVRRFTIAHSLANDASSTWASIAASTGYADQAHLTREFRAIAGMSPRELRSRAVGDRHVPLDGSSDSFKTARGERGRMGA